MNTDIQRGYGRIATPAADGALKNPPFTVYADTSSGDATITVVVGGNEFQTTNVKAGYGVSGTGVPGATTVLSVTDSDNFEMSANASATGTNVVLTITPTEATVTGRIVNPNLTEDFDTKLKEQNVSGAVDTKRYMGRNITGSIELEIIATSTVWPRAGGLIELTDMSNPNHNKTFAIESIGTTYPKGNFVLVTLNVEWSELVEGVL